MNVRNPFVAEGSRFPLLLLKYTHSVACSTSDIRTVQNPIVVIVER